MTDIKQFILANGDEIVCEVLEWADEQTPDMVVRRAFKVITLDDHIRGMRFYTLRPWMLYQSGKDVYNTINSMHIVAEANPSKKILTQYEASIEEAEQDEEVISERIEKATQRFKQAQEKTADSNNNIVYFGRFNKDKLH